MNILKKILSRRTTKALEEAECVCDSYWENKNDLSYLEHAFHVEETLRNNKTKILKCKTCNNTFLKHDTLIHKLDSKSLDLLNRWNSSSQKLNPNDINILKEIGIIEGWHDTILIPCKAKTKTKNTLEYCLLIFTDLPPFQEVYNDNYKNVFMINEITEISKSDYSLPVNIRKLTRNQREAGMGFTPTVLEAPDGKLFCLNGSNDFFKHGNTNPRELTVKEFSREKYQTDYIIYKLKEDITYIICDKNIQIEKNKA